MKSFWKYFFEKRNRLEAPPDVEVLFEFNGTRLTPVADGYRPDHAIIEGYIITTGIHHYYDVKEVVFNVKRVKFFDKNFSEM